jgi:hypothetical protein
MDAVLNRCDGVPPEVNINPANGANQAGSDLGSGIGEQFNSAISDVTKAASMHSSAGKRSLTASLNSIPPLDDGKASTRPSPIKKKLRVRGSNLNAPLGLQDAFDDDDDTLPPVPINLAARFSEVDGSHNNEDVTPEVLMQDDGSATTNETNAEPQQRNNLQSPPDTASPNPQYNKNHGSDEANSK